MFGLYAYGSDETIYLRNFYHEAFTGDPYQEDIRSKKVVKVIEQMGDNYLLANPIKRLTTQEK